MEVKQNTLYLTTSGNYIARDHLTLRVEQERELKLAVPVHHVESICSFGQNTFSPAALQLCWEHGVTVCFFTESGYFQGRWEGVMNTSVGLRRAQYRAADDPQRCAGLARSFIAGKIQNSRASILRSRRECESDEERARLRQCAVEMRNILRWLERDAETLDQMRGYEGQAASIYYAAFDLHLRQQREDFSFTTRSRRPPRDRINSLLSFLYGMLRHDIIAALTVTGLDPFVGFLHTERPARPALALDMMEEFRPVMCDRLAVTLINRRQLTRDDFIVREGGAVEFTKEGKRKIITGYQTRKQETVVHPLLGQEFRYGQLVIAQARILARHLRGDIPQYLPCVLR